MPTTSVTQGFACVSVTSAGRLGMAVDCMHLSASAFISFSTWPLILQEASAGIMASQDSRTVKVDAARLFMPRTRIFVTFYWAKQVIRPAQT